MNPPVVHSAFLALLGLLLSPIAVVHASPSPADSVHFCLLLDFEQWQRDRPRPAAKRLADLDVGEPRTVRLIYFLPNDRPFSGDVVQRMKEEILHIQTFYAEQMEAHGYGAKTFRIETDDQGEPMVHRVDGQHLNSHYRDNTVGTVLDEIEQAFDVRDNIYFIVVDNGTHTIGNGGLQVGGTGSGEKNGGFALFPAGFEWYVAAHELGHAFGMVWHDFRDNEYIMSYGGNQRNALSACSAEFLAVHPYFNSNSLTGTGVEDEEAQSPTIELISPRAYPAGSESVSVQLRVSDSEGLHQVILFVRTRAGYSGSLGHYYAVGSLEVISCRGLAGKKDAVVEFDYDGVIPSDGFNSLPIDAVHPIIVGAVDIDGNISYLSFDLVEVSPHHISFLEGHMSAVISMAFSPDGTTLASVSESDTVRLWDVSTEENIATLEGSSVAFSPDGTTLAAGSGDGTVKLWEISTWRNIATFKWHNLVNSVTFSPDGTILAFGTYREVKLWEVATERNVATLEHTGWVSSVTFSPDGTMLASASDDGTVKLWDVETRTNTATLEGDELVALVAFSPDGTTLAYRAWGGIGLWDVASGQDIATLEHTGLVLSVAFSPDGTTLASGSYGAIGLWDAATEQRIATLSGSLVLVHSVAFSSDGTMLASGSGDGTVQLWDVSEWTSPRPRMILKISGDNQQGTPGTELANPFVVEVRDQNDNPLPGAQVAFTVTAGDGTLSGRFTIEKATTDANGRAESSLTLGPNPGTNTVEVSVAGVELVTFNAVGVGTPTLPIMDGDFQTWHLPDSATIRLGKGRVGSSDRAVAFSPDGQSLAVASDLGIWLYNVATSHALALLPTVRQISSVAFSPDGTTLASGSADASVSSVEASKLWDVATGQYIATFNHRAESVAFSPDGTTLASGSADYAIELWDVATGQHIATLSGHTREVNSVAFSPDGITLASGSGDGTVKLWEVATGTNTATLSGHTREVNSVAFSPDGITLASGSGDGTVKLWEVATGTNTATFSGHGHWVNSVAFSPDGITLASGSGDGTVKLWEVATGTNTATFSGHGHWVNSVAFSPDGTTLAFGSRYDGMVLLWEVATGNAASLSGHAPRVNSVSFSPDGTMLASGSNDRTVKLWDVATGRNTASLSGHTDRVNSVSFSPDGTMLASGSDDNTVKLWEVATGTNTASLSGHTGLIRSVSFSPDGTMLASGSNDRTVKLWDVATGRNIATLEGHANRVRSVSFSPDGTMLASGSDDGIVKLWDVATRTNTATFSGHTSWVLSVSFSPDGTTLASGSRHGTIKVWDVATGTNTATFSADRFSSVTFSLDGTMLASGSGGGTVKLWDVATGTHTATLYGHTGRTRSVASSVRSVAFSPDGKTLASGSDDGTVLLWDMQLLLPHPRTLTKLSGDEQQGPAGGALGEPFVVSALDQNGEPFAGAVVTFVVTTGGGTLSAATATTDAKGQAASILTLGSQPGPNTVVVTVADLEPEIFTAVAETTPDFDGDGVTNFADFFLFADAFGGSDPRFDLDGSGAVDFADFFLFVDAFDQPAQAKLLVLAQELIGLPDGPQLQQNAPNPFNRQTVISYFLLAPGPARLELFALTGQRVAVLSRGQQKAGRHRLHWDGRDEAGRPLASGIYLYRLVTGEGALTRKLILLR